MKKHLRKKPAPQPAKAPDTPAQPATGEEAQPANAMAETLPPSAFIGFAIPGSAPAGQSPRMILIDAFQISAIEEAPGGESCALYVGGTSHRVIGDAESIVDAIDAARAETYLGPLAQDDDDSPTPPRHDAPFNN